MFRGGTGEENVTKEELPFRKKTKHLILGGNWGSYNSFHGSGPTRGGGGSREKMGDFSVKQRDRGQAFSKGNVNRVELDYDSHPLGRNEFVCQNMCQRRKGGGKTGGAGWKVISRLQVGPAFLHHHVRRKDALRIGGQQGQRRLSHCSI